MRPIPHPAKALIIARGERLNAAAKAVDVNAHTLGRVLNGHVPPWPALRRRVAEHLGLAEHEVWNEPGTPPAEAVERVAALLARKAS